MERLNDQHMKKTKEYEKDRDFFKVPTVLVESSLLARMKPSEIKVYCVIGRYADYKTGRSFPSISRICELSGMNKNVVCKAIKRLEYFGVVQKYRAPKGFKFKNVYKVIRNPIINPCIIPQKMERKSTRSRGKDGKWRADPKDVKDNTFPRKVEAVIPHKMETDTIPHKMELRTYPQKMESKEKEIELKRDRLISPKKISDIDIRLTNFFKEKMSENDPNSPVKRMSKKTMETWLNECRKLREIDNRTPEEIEAVIKWCQNDHFEKTVVLSMPKLRQRFSQLWIKAGKPDSQDSRSWAERRNEKEEVEPF